MATNSKKETRLVQSIVRATDILNLFLLEKTPLGITDFSRKLGLPKTTIQGIVNTLMSLHFLEKDPVTSRYRLGPAVFQLGMRYATNLDLVAITRSWMERLCFQFRIPVNVGMLVGNRVVIIMRVEPDNKFMSFPPAGSVIPIHTTCIGKILMAFGSDDQRENVLNNYRFDALTQSSINDKDEFQHELEKVKENGISFDREENMTGLRGIGGPIYDHTRQVIAAFAITGNSNDIESQKEEIIDAVKYTSSSASAQLGYDYTEI